MKHLTQFITEYIVKKKLGKPIDSISKHDYFPKTREELKIISEQIAENNSIVDALCKAEEEFTFTYVPSENSFSVTVLYGTLTVVSGFFH